MTTRGFKEDEACAVGHLIADLLDAPDNPDVLAASKAKVAVLTQAFPVYRR